MDLSIVIPTYNRHHHLSECLQSLEHNDAEIIVVDDGSPNPVEVGPRIHLIRHESNRGRAAAVNAGLKAAAHNLTLIIDDDIFAAPDMVTRLADEFAVWNNPKLALAGRVVWDPDVRMTITMRWLEEFGPYRETAKKRSGVLPHLVTANMMLWRPFVLQHGGFDEEFTHRGSADADLGLRLRQHGLEVRLLASALGFHHKTMRVRDLVERELREGLSAVYLHSKFPDYLPQIDDTASLMHNAPSETEAAYAVEEIALLEQGDSSQLQFGMADLFKVVQRFYFLQGILKGLNARDTARASNGVSATLHLFNQASLLQATGESSEARRLFRLVRSRPESAHWAAAEYHLGLIEHNDGNLETATQHFRNCQTLDPYHKMAHEWLKRPSVFKEIEANVYERVEPLPQTRILFAVFGELDEVLNAFPVIRALRHRFRSSEIVWITSPEYSALACTSGVDDAVEFEPRGAIPWDWVIRQEFTHVFHPEVAANADEWEAGTLHPMDFMARKCRVELDSRIATLDPGPTAQLEAESFLTEYGLTRFGFVTLCYSGGTLRLWQTHNLHKLATAIGLPVVIIGGDEETGIAGTIPCFRRSYRTVTALIACSAFYIGPDFGESWLAATTGTPMGVVLSAASSFQGRPGFKEIAGMERSDIFEWEMDANPESIVEQILSSERVSTRLAVASQLE